MAECKVTNRQTWLVEGPRPGTLRCPECGAVLDEETTFLLDELEEVED